MNSMSKNQNETFSHYNPKLTGTRSDVVRGLAHSRNSRLTNAYGFCENKGERIWNADGYTTSKYLDDLEKEIYCSYRSIKHRQLSIQKELEKVADEKKRILSNWQKHKDVLAEKRETIARLKQEACRILELSERHQATLGKQLVKSQKMQAKMLYMNLCIRHTQMNICKDKIQIFDKNIVDSSHPLMTSVAEKQEALASLKAELSDYTQLQKLVKESRHKFLKQQKFQERLYKFLCSRALQAEHNIEGLEEFMKELNHYIEQLSVRYDSLVVETTSIAMERVALKEKLQNIRTSRKLKLLTFDSQIF